MNPQLILPTNEKKVLRDPIHRYITVNYQIIWDILNCSEFQRLRRIHQLGADYQVYPAAEHSRFVHSLGVYEVVRRMVEENQSISSSLSEEEKVIVMLAGLLHDIGHGPYSHTFEKIIHESHEAWTCKIIKNKKGEIGNLLNKIDCNLANEIISILEHTHSNPLLSDLISSQLDADRMDYLLRDAYFSGTSYGNFDLERVLRILRIGKDQQGNKRLCIKESGVHAIEDYIMARYQMYHQVYLHPDTMGYEWMIQQFFIRYQKVRKQSPIQALELMFQQPLTTEVYCSLDEARFIYAFHEGKNHEDEQLRHLSIALLDRKLPGWMMVTSFQANKIKEAMVQWSQEDEKWNLFICDHTQEVWKGCLPYHETNSKEWIQPVWVVQEDGRVKKLSQCSALAKALLEVSPKNLQQIFFPKEELKRIQSVLETFSYD